MIASTARDVRMPKPANQKKKPKEKEEKRERLTTIIDSKGGPHTYLNHAVPQTPKGEAVAPLHTAICEAGCNHAYSHLMTMHAQGIKTCQCVECREDAWAEHILEVQSMGVALGLSDSRPDSHDRSDLRDASSERCVRERRLRRMGEEYMESTNVHRKR